MSAESVSKAVAARRLLESVVMVDGHPKIADPELADREWAANTRPRVEAAPAQPAADTKTRAPASDDGIPYAESLAKRAAAAARREVALADMAELDLGERRGELVAADEALAEVIERFTLVKTRLLGVPARVAQRLPHLAAEVVPVIDELLREALEELADDGDAE